MILNMSNVGNQVIYKDSIDNGNGSTSLVVSGVQIPGGIVKGFALMKVGNYAVVMNNIVCAYADQTKAETGKFNFEYYSNGYMYSGSAGSFSYDSSTQTFTLDADPLIFSHEFVLFIW